MSEGTRQVQQGSVDLFLAGQPDQARVPFARAVAGEAYRTLDGALLAVPGPDAVVVDGGPDGAWIPVLSRGLAAGRSPGDVRSLFPAMALDVPAGGACTSGHGVVEVRGDRPLLYLDSCPVAPGTWVPLTAETWLRAPEGAHLEAREPGGDLAVLEALGRQEATRLRAAWLEAADRRLQARAEGDARAAVAGVEDLASVLQAAPPGRNGVLPGEAPVVAAARLVAGAEGIRLTTPRTTTGDPRDVLEALARASRVRLRRVALKGAWWRDAAGAMLGFRKDGRPVALLPRGPRAMDLVDADGRRPVDGSEDLDPHAWVFYRPLPEGPLSLARLVRFGMRGTARDLRALALAGSGAGLLALAVPVATGVLVGQVIPMADRSRLAALVGVLLCTAVGSLAFEALRTVAVLRVQGRMSGALQAAVWDRLLRLPAGFFRRFSAGDLANRALAVDTIEGALSGAATSAILGGVFSLFSFGLLFVYSPELALIAAATLLVLIGATAVATLRQVQLQRDVFARQGALGGLVLQLFSGIAKIRVAAAEDRAYGRWARDFADMRRLDYRVRRIGNALYVFGSAFPFLSALVLFLAARGMDSAAFLAFFTAFGQFSGSLLSVAYALGTLLTVVPVSERLRPILDEAPEVTSVRQDPGSLSGRVELSRVSFRYTADGPTVLEDVSLAAEPGEFVALVGPSGAGKSTLLRMLLGFETPTSGSVYYDGRDLQGLDVDAVRRQVGVVLQDGKLMPGDLFSNIVGSTSHTIEEAWEAARLAGIADDIRAAPMGMHTIVMEGAGAFSGGQRQRLLIARALVRKPRVLLLDEATSSLDAVTQEVVSRNLDAMRATRIVIAHRLSTIRQADRIYVLEGGRVVQTGTFAELSTADGPFARLVRLQQA